MAARADGGLAPSSRAISRIFFWWWYSFDADDAPQIFVEGDCLASAGGFATITVAIAMSVWRAREAREVTT